MVQESRVREQFFLLPAHSPEQIDLPSNTTNPVQITSYPDFKDEANVIIFRIDSYWCFAVDQGDADTKITSKTSRNFASVNQREVFIKEEGLVFARAKTATSSTVEAVDKRILKQSTVK